MNPLLFRGIDMRLKHLLGVVAVMLLILAVWLVPMALADDGAMDNAGPLYQTGSQAPSGSECPYLQAHPWLDPHGSGDGAGGATRETRYY
jgi:hypothetical protein